MRSTHGSNSLNLLLTGALLSLLGLRGREGGGEGGGEGGEGGGEGGREGRGGRVFLFFFLFFVFIDFFFLFFSEMAKKYNMVIVSHILERDEEHGETIWNTAVGLFYD